MTTINTPSNNVIFFRQEEDKPEILGRIHARLNGKLYIKPLIGREVFKLPDDTKLVRLAHYVNKAYI